MKKQIFTENDFLVASQDSLNKLIASSDGALFKKYLINRLNDYQITHNQFGFIQDVCIDMMNEFKNKDVKNEKV